MIARGRVVAGDRGVPGVNVTDGFTVAETDADGAFSLPSRRGRFVSVRLPARYAAAHGLPWAPAADDLRFELRRGDDDGARHGFVVLADPQPSREAHLAEFEATTVPAVARAAGTLPGGVFGVGLGDHVGDAPQVLPASAAAVARTGLPFFHLLGNHDGSPGDRKGPFHRRFGPARYSFDRGEIRYVVMDNVSWFCGRYRGRLGRAQLDWLRADLAGVERGRGQTREVMDRLVALEIVPAG